MTETMNGRGYRAEALHGGMDQAQRDRVMARLRDGTAELLDRHRRRGTRARHRHPHPRRQLRRTVRRRELRPPHRPCGARRTRGCRDHPGRTARAARAREHRAADEAEVRDRQGADGVGPAHPPDRDDRDGGARGTRCCRPRGLQRRAQRVGRRGQRAQHRARGDQARARVTRLDDRRTRDPGRVRPPAAAARATARSSTRTSSATPANATAAARRESIPAPARDSSTSASGARQAFARAISSAPSPTRPVSSAVRSARSGSPTPTRSSACPKPPSNTSSRRWPAPRCEASAPGSAATPTDRSGSARAVITRNSPIRVALVNDYEIIVEGLREMLKPFGDRVRVVETVAGDTPDGSSDIALFDTFAGRRHALGRIREMLADHDIAKVVLYTWDAPDGVPRRHHRDAYRRRDPQVGDRRTTRRGTRACPSRRARRPRCDPRTKCPRRPDRAGTGSLGADRQRCVEP